MTDEENVGVVAEATEAVAEAPESENVAQTQPAATRKNDAEHNWAEMREQKRKLERKVQDLEEGYNRLNQQNKPPEQEENFGVKDDDLIEGKHYKELKKEVRALKNELKTREAATVDDRINFKFPDYREVVSKENIEFLKDNEPELAASLVNIQDPYLQAVTAYKMLKTMVKTPESNESKLEKKQLLENSTKPRMTQAVAKTSSMADLNQFAEMDPKSKQAFLKSKYEEMQKSIKAG